MTLWQRLFQRKPPELPPPLFSDEEIAARERLHDEWERDYLERKRQAYELERRANYLTSRIFAPSNEESHGSR